jgi:hypothetical protein
MAKIIAELPFDNAKYHPESPFAVCWLEVNSQRDRARNIFKKAG